MLFFLSKKCFSRLDCESSFQLLCLMPRSYSRCVYQLCVYVCVYVSVWMCVCVCVCVYLTMFVSACVYTCVYVFVGAVALAEYVADSLHLLRLDLRENDIKTAGLMALSLALKVNESVTRMDIDKETKKESVSTLRSLVY